MANIHVSLTRSWSVCLVLSTTASKIDQHLEKNYVKSSSFSSTRSWSACGVFSDALQTLKNPPYLSKNTLGGTPGHAVRACFNLTSPPPLSVFSQDAPPPPPSCFSFGRLRADVPPPFSCFSVKNLEMAINRYGKHHLRWNRYEIEALGELRLII